MEPHPAFCDLCGLSLRFQNYSATVSGTTFRFCCLGCRQVFHLLLEATPGADPISFRETDLFKKCREMGIIPASEADLVRRREGDSPSSATPSDVAWEGGPREGAGGEALPLILVVHGMWCPACAWVIEEALRRAPGVHAAACNFSTDRVRCEYDPVLTSPREIMARIDLLGYTALPPGEERGARERRLEFIRFAVSAFLAVNVMMLSLALYTGFFTTLSAENVRALSWPIFAMASIVFFAGGWPIHRKAWQSLVAAAPGMETLISLGALSAYVYSTFNLLRGSIHLYFDTSSMLITLLLLGRFLERRAKDEVQEDLANFFSLRPTKVRICSESNPQGRHLPAEALRREDVFRVEGGELLAADGVIVSGTALLDESSLTGEPAPVRKKPGDRVRSGTKVQQGELTIRAESVGDDSTLGQMIAIMEKALGRRTPLEGKTDLVLRWFVPVILVLAATTGAVCIGTGLGADEALIRAVTVMVISCPCALGIAVPLARVAAISLAGRRGILVRDFTAFDIAGRVNAVVLDKTGTVTRGTWRLVEIVPVGGLSRERALALAASLERHGDHPVAREIARQAEAKGLQAVELREVKVSENGISGVFGGDEIKIGSAGFVARELEASDPGAVAASEPGRSVVFLTGRGRLAGLFHFGDEIKATARETVKWLLSTQSRVALVSGDGEAATEAVAREIGIAEVYGNRLPRDKAAYVAELQQQGRRVAMVGDGINDALALAQADLAISVHSGGHLGREAAHLTLMRGDPSQLRDFFALAERVRRKIRQNLVSASVYNAVSIPVAMAGLLTPLVAVSAMLLSSLTVIGNTLLLVRKS
jgi:heavy metal translocating P-type ATPase